MKNSLKTAKIVDFISIFMLNAGFFYAYAQASPVQGVELRSESTEPGQNAMPPLGMPVTLSPARAARSVLPSSACRVSNAQKGSMLANRRRIISERTAHNLDHKIW